MTDKKTPLFHLGFCPGDISARYAIIPGDPGRVREIAEKMDSPRPLAAHREFTSYTAMLNGHQVIVCSTGIGGPSAAIAVEELHMAGVDTFIRVGTCGGINLAVERGSLVIASCATRCDGTSAQYAPLSFPAAADFAVTSALVKSAGGLGHKCFTGPVHCKDSFYAQHSPQRMPIAPQLLNDWEAFIKLGVLASEMECAALYTVSAALGCRAGCVLNVFWNQERIRAGLDQTAVFDTDIPDNSRAIDTAIGALWLLIAGE